MADNHSRFNPRWWSSTTRGKLSAELTALIVAVTEEAAALVLGEISAGEFDRWVQPDQMV